MRRRFFGTDGIRGRVGQAPVVPEAVLRIGYAAGVVLARQGASLDGSERPAVVIGKDTRISGYMLESALVSGFCAAGVDVYLVGPLPTPAIAYLTRALRLHAGVVISASHNAFEDNGIKFFGAAGQKLDDLLEEQIETVMEQPLVVVPTGGLGKVRRLEDAAGRYIEFCKSAFPNQLDLKGMKLVVDCAHGATYHVAPNVFHELGADVTVLGAEPDGVNINVRCGTTDTAWLRQTVCAVGADLGIALDGDGDRLIMVGSTGEVYDGDQLLYLIACARLKKNQLVGGVVGTQMTNLAVALALEAEGIPFARARVGDRYVLEQLLLRGWKLGGESSGHLICLDWHTTGDGVISALQVLKTLRETGHSLDALLSHISLFPQRMVNVPVPPNSDVQQDPGVSALLSEAERSLGSRGRVVLRPSGTEPVIRVMVEAQSASEAERWSQRLAQAVAEAFSAAVLQTVC